MNIILSQRVDYASTYQDEVFKLYHFPARYKNQIHTGDTFIYYQGDRYKSAHRYYFGTGSIGKISSDDGENYYAEIASSDTFENKVLIKDHENKYFESMDFEKVRKSVNPPWQSSIRPLSDAAFKMIISQAGNLTHQINMNEQELKQEDNLDQHLNDAINSYFSGKNDKSLLKIIAVAKQIAIKKDLLDE